METKHYGTRTFNSKTGISRASYMPSPWGAVQTAHVISRGVCVVTTASHGGLKVSKRLAETTLSKEALSYAIYNYNAYWFEEDVCCSIPFFEKPEWYDALVKNKVFGSSKQDELLRVLQRWYPEYLESRNLLSNP